MRNLDHVFEELGIHKWVFRNDLEQLEYVLELFRHTSKSQNGLCSISIFIVPTPARR